MHRIILGKRVLITLFLLFFTSCSKPCQQWDFERIQTHHSCFNSAVVQWITQNQFNGIDIQILCTPDDTFVYFDIHLFEFPFENNDCHKAKINIYTENQEYCFLAERLEGGQRLFLSIEAGSLVLDLLSEEIAFTISVGNYTETVLPTQFREAFQKAQKFISY